MMVHAMLSDPCYLHVSKFMATLYIILVGLLILKSYPTVFLVIAYWTHWDLLTCISAWTHLIHSSQNNMQTERQPSFICTFLNLQCRSSAEACAKMHIVEKNVHKNPYNNENNLQKWILEKSTCQNACILDKIAYRSMSVRRTDH